MYLSALGEQIRPGVVEDVHCGKLVSGVTVTCNPNLISAPRMIPVGIATYCIFWVTQAEWFHTIRTLRTSLARFVASALLSQEEMRATGLNELSWRT